MRQALEPGHTILLDEGKLLLTVEDTQHAFVRQGGMLSSRKSVTVPGLDIELPAVQKRIAALCTEAGKPFMVATQPLSSMEKNPFPTRAEVSDVFNAGPKSLCSLTAHFSCRRSNTQHILYAVECYA